MLKRVDIPTTLYVAQEVQQDKLPNTSVHVLEEITKTQEEHVEVANAATTQSPFLDVIELERSAHTQTIPRTAGNDVSDETNVEIKAIAPVRGNHVQHHEIPISKNVQSDLDLWARIREYDQQMAEEGFTQVLSKKQQQAVKKKVLGKASYNTRAKGSPPPSS